MFGKHVFPAQLYIVQVAQAFLPVESSADTNVCATVVSAQL